MACNGGQRTTIFHQFERLQTVRAAFDVLIFALTVWAFTSFIC